MGYVVSGIGVANEVKVSVRPHASKRPKDTSTLLLDVCMRSIVNRLPSRRISSGFPVDTGSNNSEWKHECHEPNNLLESLQPGAPRIHGSLGPAWLLRYLDAVCQQAAADQRSSCFLGFGLALGDKPESANATLGFLGGTWLGTLQSPSINLVPRGIFALSASSPDEAGG